MAKRPDIKETEMQKLEGQFQTFEDSMKELTQERMNEAPKMEMEQQTKLSSQQIAKSKDFYIKPSKTVGSKEKFNERFREEYEYKKEYVRFIAENKEIIGESIPVWTKPYPGMPAEEWMVPVNKPIWGPRYLAEQIKRKYYHRLVMKEDVISQDSTGSMYGRMVSDSTIPRLDAYPAGETVQFAKKSSF